MLSKQSMEMLLDLVENRISDPELYEPAGKREFQRLKSALDELTALGRSAAARSVQARGRGRPPKSMSLHF